MKAAVPVLVILALLSALLLTGASAALAQDCDKVVLTETVLAGDTSRAAGLSVTASSHCRDHLLWESRFSVGRLEELETDFSLSQEEVLDGYRTSDFAGDCLSLSFFEGGISSSGSLEEGVAEDVMLQSIFALAKDVASPGRAGGEYTETVDLAEYYEYVPLYADLYGIPGVTPEKELALTGCARTISASPCRKAGCWRSPWRPFPTARSAASASTAWSGSWICTATASRPATASCLYPRSASATGASRT